MIAELFYPKELKEVIADLRAKDDLNEEALMSINKTFYATFSILLIFAALLFVFPVVQSRNWIFVPFALLMFLPFFLWCEIKRAYKNFYGSYVHGQEKEGTVKRIIFFKDPVRKIVVQDSDTGEKIIIGPLGQWNKHTENISEGSVIKFYISKTLYKPMPSIGFYKKKYCLSSQKVQKG